ncbi:Phosphate transport system permease protein PstA [Serinicoccus hydrothermalis]|uniref:Phosphate transport system permease protein PstA n=1 Tax=Serinicoccus hydrothermalis TaxID=1758689 RepID=A0A1B1NC05_9MICO|nr:phosphate ABC transporter permease PstA [Serinicoccus hydrothermalis]ANS78956.1 Phosphate transport system permease protein PstA [Serinicoccus hydrothermalis]
MSTTTQTTQTPRQDDEPSYIPSPVRATSSRPLLLIGAGAVLLWLLLWFVVDLHPVFALVVSYLAFLATSWATYRATGGSRVATDVVMRWLVYAAFICAIVPLVSMLWTVFSQGLPLAFSPGFWTQDMVGITGADDQAYANGETSTLAGGAGHAIVGTLIITGAAALISVPIGLFTAIYLVEYGGSNHLSKGIRFLVDVMTGIPSIVAGLFAFALFTQVVGIRDAKMGIAGAVALSVLMIPTVVRNSEEMLRIVPNELREASLALGVPKWRTIAKVVLPTAASGLASGITLAIARVIGETAPLLVAIGFARSFNTNMFEGPINSLAVYTYWMFTKPLDPALIEPSRERAWAAALLLVLIVVALNLAARAIAKFFAPKTGR